MDAAALTTLETEARQALKTAETPEALEAFRVDFLGRKGRVPMFLRSLADMPLEVRRELGSRGNALRVALEDAVAEKIHMRSVAQGAGAHAALLDPTRPGQQVPRGHAHVLSQTLADAVRALSSLGFTVAEGPEVECEWYNFDALNMPADHPARDMQDTFWLAHPGTPSSRERLLLRTHTSPVQARWMESHTPPYRICCPGRCWRRDASDATHDSQFSQIEMLAVDHDTSVAHLKYVVEQFLSVFFKTAITVRLRPAYFPFVEPGFEFDMSCFRCGGAKCSVCKTGWIELGGAGMVNQAVFEAAGYQRNAWQGMAFGFGLERLALLRHRIPDIRLLTGGDLRFIEQF